MAAASAAASSPFLNGSLLIHSLLGAAGGLTDPVSPPLHPVAASAAFSPPGDLASRLSQPPQQAPQSARMPSLAASEAGAAKTKSSSIADLRLKARRHQEAILRSLSSLSDDLDG